MDVSVITLNIITFNFRVLEVSGSVLGQDIGRFQSCVLLLRVLWQVYMDVTKYVASIFTRSSAESSISSPVARQSGVKPQCNDCRRNLPIDTFIKFYVTNSMEKSPSRETNKF